jgi:plasmid stabilization system protein ParE
VNAGERLYTYARGRAKYKYTCVHPFTRETPDRPGIPLCDRCWGNVELYEQRHWDPAAAARFVELAKDAFPGSSDPLRLGTRRPREGKGRASRAPPPAISAASSAWQSDPPPRCEILRLGPLRLPRESLRIQEGSP